MSKKSRTNKPKVTRQDISYLRGVVDKKSLEVVRATKGLSDDEMEAINATIAATHKSPKPRKGTQRIIREHKMLIGELERLIIMHRHALNYHKWKALSKPLNSKPCAEVSDPIPHSIEEWTELDYERAARRLCQKVMNDEQREMFRRIWIHEFLYSPTPDDLASLDD